MIIDIKQTTHNLAFHFEIMLGDQITYKGSTSRMNAVMPTEMTDLEDHVLYQLKHPHIENLTKDIPFKWLFSDQIGNISDIYTQTGQCIGKIQHKVKGFLNSYHEIIIENQSLMIYSMSVGNTEYDAVMVKGQQIAMVTHSLVIKNNLDQYRVYLLEDFECFKELMALYCLYKDNYYASKRNEVVAYSYEKEWSYSYSRTDHYFDDNWLHDHFGMEVVNFSETSQKMKKVSQIVFPILVLILIGIIFVIFKTKMH